MNRRLALVVVAGCVAVVAGCSATTASSSYEEASRGGGDDTGGVAAPGVSGSAGSSSGSSGASDPGPTSPGAMPAGPQAGTLTAGVWDDNLNYEFFGKYLTESKGMSAWSIFTQADRDAAHARALAQRSAKSELDVMLVLDTTSSMSDELTYLQAEFQSIATTVKVKFPNTTPRFSLVVYRDTTDEYLTRTFDFSPDVAAFQSRLAAQATGGGGDIPEAVPEGLQAGVDLGWRTTDDVARVMFWVADAPHHAGDEQRVNAAVTGALQKGIHVYPVASSGIDGSAELTMRSAAQLTGGRYLFLTDDSGIGNAHAEPHIPCYVVTPLQGAIVRMVESEMKGARVEAAASEVIRTVGNPSDGKCTIKDQSQVVLY